MPHPLRRAVTPFLLLLVAACGGAVTDISGGKDAGSHRDAGHGGNRDSGLPPPPPPDDAGSNDDFPVFREDACSDPNAPPPMVECDPFAQSTCGAGFACYPVPPRSSDNCHPGKYGTICLPGGKGTQGWPCGDATDCFGGFICVIAGTGDQCVKLCKVDDFNACPDGRICREVDVPGSGWGGCE